MGIFKGVFFFFFFDFFLDPLSLIGSFQGLLILCAICCVIGWLGLIGCGRHRASDEDPT